MAECTTYGFKESLEREKVKSWLKSASAFANAEGGSLYLGVADDGSIARLDDATNDSEYQGNPLYLLEMTTGSIRANTSKKRLRNLTDKGI